MFKRSALRCFLIQSILFRGGQNDLSQKPFLMTTPALAVVGRYCVAWCIKSFHIVSLYETLLSETLLSGFTLQSGIPLKILGLPDSSVR